MALLLPLSGRNGAVGTIVRDGFMTALYQVPVAQRLARSRVRHR